MKTITIPDLHGKDYWRDHVDPSEYDLMVFLGDYVDSWDVSNTYIKYCLESVISLKKEFPEKVVLLLGNHEFNYLYPDIKYRCSGFRPEAYHDLHHLLYENRTLFKASHQIDNYLWLHAGIHRGWEKFRFPLNTNISVADQLNDAFDQNKQELFDVGIMRGGNKHVGGPFWVDKSLLSNKPLLGYHQIVGHNPVDDITKIEIDDDTSVTYCDCLDTRMEFYKLEI
jgi:predicted MPP superfamily phosphohydrolase